MNMDFATLATLRVHHPAWRLLRSDHAALIASFLHRAFVASNVRTMASADLIEALEDELFGLRATVGSDAFPKPAAEYLNDWAGPEKGWLRKFYLPDSDEPRFDLTPATEKAIAWLNSLGERSFVGTESRLRTLFELLAQMSQGSETDPEKRLSELHRRRAEVDAEIARVEAGDLPLLEDSALKDRFQQFMQLARELLTDFREVEHNFRLLDRRMRERIALWEGGKGALLAQIMGERDAISDSDQGRSFRAFWDFLMSSRRQEELSERLDQVLKLPAVAELKPDARTRRVHYDWLEAGEHTQRTVAQLSHQLRRFLDDKAWLENRRIMDILHGIETKALALRSTPPTGIFMNVDATSASVDLPMERPLFTPAVKALIHDLALASEESDIDASALYAHVVIDKARLARHIRQCLQERSQVSLRELVERQPLAQGLGEVVAYLQLGCDAFKTVVDAETVETITWQYVDAKGHSTDKRAHLQRVVFVR